MLKNDFIFYGDMCGVLHVHANGGSIAITVSPTGVYQVARSNT